MLKRLSYGADTAAFEDDKLNKLADFAGKRLLVVEDGFFLDDTTKRLLQVAGADVEVVSADRAERLFEQRTLPDGVILDIQIDAELAFSLAEQFEAQGVPFLFALNDRATGQTSRFAAYRLCGDIDELKAIGDLLFGKPAMH